MKDILSNLKLEYQKYKTMLLTIKATDINLINFVQKEIKNLEHRIETIKKTKRR